MSMNSLKYPLDSDNLFETLAIGTVLVILSIFILPLFILVGYQMKIINYSSRNKNVPKFEYYMEFVINGMKYALIAIVYVILLFLLMIITSFIGEINSIIGGISLLVIILAYLTYLYLIPAIMFEFAQKYKIEDAFDFKEMLSYAKSIEYLKISVLLTIVYPILFGIVQVGLAITVIGIILIPSTIVYELMVYGHLVSKINEIKSD